MLYFKKVTVYLNLIYVLWGSIIHAHKKSGFLRAGQFLRCWDDWADLFLPSLVFRSWISVLVPTREGSFHGIEMVAVCFFLKNCWTTRANFWEPNSLPLEFKCSPCVEKWFLSKFISNTFTFDWNFIINELTTLMSNSRPIC